MKKYITYPTQQQPKGGKTPNGQGMYIFNVTGS